MELNREQTIKELEGLVKFITCLEYVQKVFALIIEITNENKNLLARNLELPEDVDEWKALAEDYKNRFVKCRNEKAKLTEENERLRAENENKCKDCAGCLQWKCDCANIEDYAVEKYKSAIIEYYSKPNYQPTKEHPIKHTQIEHLFAVLDQIAKEMEKKNENI